MDIGEMVVHGWKFHLVNDELSITSEQDPNVHVELEAKAAYSLLDYLYQYRDDLAVAALGSQVLEEGTSKVKSGSPLIQVVQVVQQARSYLRGGYKDKIAAS